MMHEQKADNFLYLFVFLFSMNRYTAARIYISILHPRYQTKVEIIFSLPLISFASPLLDWFHFIECNCFSLIVKK
jgi:hypothetical protein